MNLNQIKSYEIKTAKTGEKIPVVNEVHLHSIYNPKKEAESISSKHLNGIKDKKNILILGLGFGYHISEIVKLARQYHGENFKIMVIEPNLKVTNDARELNLINEDDVIIYAGEDVPSLYQDSELVDFLTSKPTIIAHPSSFSLYQAYFKQFLSHEATSDAQTTLGVIQNEDFYNYLREFGEFNSVESLIDLTILNQTVLKDEKDHLMLAYRHLVLSDF